MHGKDREFSVEFYMEVRAFARREDRPLLLQPALQFLARHGSNVIVFGYKSSKIANKTAGLPILRALFEGWETTNLNPRPVFYSL